MVDELLLWTEDLLVTSVRETGICAWVRRLMPWSSEPEQGSGDKPLTEHCELAHPVIEASAFAALNM
jgi:hypothetical protein